MSNTTKTVILIIFGTLISNILGFCREIILAYKYGTSYIADIYLLSSIIPGTIFASIVAAISTSYIPIVSEINTSNSQKAPYFTSNVLNLLGILSIGLTIIFIVFATPIVKIFAVGFQGEMLNQTVHLTRIMFPLVVFLVFYNVFQGYLQVNDNFFIPSLIGIPLNLFFILGILLSSSNRIWVMAIGNLLGYVAVFIFLLIFVQRSGFKYYLVFNFKDPYLKKLLYLTIPVFIGVSLNQVNTIVDRSIASTLEEGIISALNYSSRLVYFANGIFVVSIVTTLFPKLSKLSSLKNLDGFKNVLSSSIIAIIAIVFPLSIGTIMLADPIVRLLFERGAFDSKATEYTSNSLIYYSIGIIGIGIRELLSKVFYSIQDTKTPMINDLMTVVLNILLNFFFVKYIGYIGLPLATSISSLVTVLLLGFKLRKKIGPFGIGYILRDTQKIIFASVIMGFIVKISYLYIYSLFGIHKLGNIAGVIISVILGALTYFFLVRFLKINGVKMIYDSIKCRLWKKSGLY